LLGRTTKPGASGHIGSPFSAMRRLRIKLSTLRKGHKAVLSAQDHL
jgi:hypothetical protein